MKKNNPDKNVNVNDSTTLPGLNELLEERDKTGLPETSRDRFKKVTGILYECLDICPYCRFRFPFGSTNFCSWLLDNHKELPENKPPCYSTDNSKQDN